MRPHDYFVDEDGDVLDFDLLERLRLRPVAEYTNVEAALALAELLHQEFLLYGTSGDQHITDAGSREGMRTLTALAKRLGVEWKPAFRDFPSFYAYWMAHNGYGSWAARREMVSNLFSPFRERLENIEDESLRVLRDHARKAVGVVVRVVRREAVRVTQLAPAIHGAY